MSLCTYDVVVCVTDELSIETSAERARKINLSNLQQPMSYM